jgi:ferrous iron transport protein A
MKQNNIKFESSGQPAALPVNGAIDLTQLENGESAKVVELQGGQQVIKKLEAMEIVPGAVIVKKTASLMKGPVVIEKGNMQFAVGYGMAKKIIVEPTFIVEPK